MVSHINFAGDDELADRARDVKDEQDLTWSEFLEAATESLEQTDGE